MKRPSVVDLFAGAGGMSLGMEAAGFDIDIALELNPIHAAVHHFNFPYTSTLCGDINTYASVKLEQALIKRGRNEVDVIVGGAPCQGFSQMGKRQLDDPRNQLVFEFFRLIRDLKPKYFVFENVPGIISAKHRQFVNELLEAFDKIGYAINLPYKVLNACNYGVAQNRKRFILLGSRKGVEKITYPIPHFDTLDQVTPTTLFSDKLSNTPTAFDAISDLEYSAAFIGEDEGILAKNLEYGNYSSKLSFDKSRAFKLCHNRQLNSAHIWGHIGSKHTSTSIERFDKTKPGTTEKISRFFKLAPNLPANTLRAGTPSGKGAFTAARPIHYTHPRCITVREAARLHSYPDWFNFHRTIWHGFRQIGNSVAPLFAKNIGEVIINQLKLNPSQLEIYTLEKQQEQLVKMNMTAAANFFGFQRNCMPVRKRVRLKPTLNP